MAPRCLDNFETIAVSIPGDAFTVPIIAAQISSSFIVRPNHSVVVTSAGVIAAGMEACGVGRESLENPPADPKLPREKMEEMVQGAEKVELRGAANAATSCSRPPRTIC